MRRLLPSGVAGLSILALLATGGAGSAVAYFTASGAGSSAPKTVAKLSTLEIESATPAPDGTVTLHWNAVNAPGAGKVNYEIKRDGAPGGGTCSHPLSATTCIDDGLEPGTHTYVVTATWRSWSVASAGATAQVTVGPADHFELAAASPTPAAGAADNLTITALDAAGNAATTYDGTHTLVFAGAVPGPNGNKPTVVSSGGSPVPFGEDTAIKFDDGVAKVSSSRNGLMKLYASGATAIEASDGSILTAAPLAVTVSPGAASKFTLAATTSAPQTGAADDLTITALDTYGNTATAYDGSNKLTFSGASAAPDGTVPTVASSTGVDVAFGSATAIEFSAGVAAAAAGANGTAKLYKSGTTNLKATAGSIKTPSALALTVSPTPATEFLLSSSSSSLKAAASANLTTTARDPYGNTDTNYTGSHALIYSGAAESPSGTAPTVVDEDGSALAFGAPTPIGFSAGVAKVSAAKNGLVRLYRAETANLTVSDGTISSPTTATVSVTATSAGRLALSEVSTSAGSLGSPCLFTCTVTDLGNEGKAMARVAVTDDYGNTVSKLGSGHAVKISSSGGSVSGSPLTLPSSGLAVTASSFTYTSKSSGNFADTVTIATSQGTAYDSATLTASR